MGTASGFPDAKADHLEAFEWASGEMHGLGELPRGVALVVRLNLDGHVVVAI